MSDTRTIRMALVDTTGRISERLGLDPETVLERMCETCEGRGTIDTSIRERHVTIHQAEKCPTCDGSGWVEVNRVVVVPVLSWCAVNPADWQLLNDLATVLAEYRRSYHSHPDAYGYHHLGVVSTEIARKADELLAKVNRTVAA